MADQNDTMLYILNIGAPSRLLALSLPQKEVTTVIADLGGAPDGIAVDDVNKRIFWTNMGTERVGEDFPADDGFVESSDFDGGNRVVIVPPGICTTPKQIQCDPRGGFIYWCDREGMRVWRARLDGAEPTVLVQTGRTEEDREDRRRHCVGVAIDTEKGHIYWTQKGKPDGGEGAIYRAPLSPAEGFDPCNRTDIELVFDRLPEPIDLELTGDAKWLYWTDRGVPPEGNTLNRAALGNGPLVREVVTHGLHEGIGLALDPRNARVFLSDLSGDVRVALASSPDDTELLLSDQGPVTGIAIVPLAC